MSAWDGDISRMGQLAERVADLATVPSRASARAAKSIRALLEDEFNEGADPYGEPWAPLEDVTLAKRTQTNEPPLTDTGTMRGTLDVRPMRGAGIAISIEHPAAPHQTGWDGPAGSGPARPILPSAEMPESWGNAIEAAVRAEFKGAA